MMMMMMIPEHLNHFTNIIFVVVETSNTAAITITISIITISIITTSIITISIITISIVISITNTIITIL